MGSPVRNIIWIVIVFLAVGRVAISVAPETSAPRQMIESFDVRRTVAPLRGGQIEVALRPIPRIHDALWPRLLPVFL